MQVEILNLYSNEIFPGSDLLPDHGQSFLIKAENHQILVDVGGKGKILLHNMKSLGVDPNDITQLIITHGHYDHTAALPEFLDARKLPIPTIAHPGIREPKRAKVLFIKKDIGFPDLTVAQEHKLDITYTAEPISILPYLKTTGEITKRSQRDGTEPSAQHEVEGEFIPDPVQDDVSLLLDTKEGQVVITGCAHAGILNILEYAKTASDKPIKAIIGGTHMVRYSEEEVLATGHIIIEKFDNPDLYINHCTDKLPSKLLKMTPARKILRKEFGKDRIQDCNVGTLLKYDI